MWGGHESSKSENLFRVAGKPDVRLVTKEDEVRRVLDYTLRIRRDQRTFWTLVFLLKNQYFDFKIDFFGDK